MPIVTSIISWLTTKRLKQINWYKLYPQDIQNEVLSQLIKDAQDTEWGQKYGYAGINSIEDFQKSVPLNDYDALKPYIERIQQGEQNILWNTPIKWFAKSSGTTNDKSKFIPVSTESLEQCHIRCGKDTILL
ncbi:MAG: GH3 auxin-responsive promoter family protein, partial [Bacteroidales bacterium]|nr:GH3 auxin-responsive promoter family protein [Bacteroidales bacterium]